MLHKIHHDSAEKHVSGEAVFVNDMDTIGTTLIGKVVYSSLPHAKIGKIDFSEALKVDGVHTILTSKDIPGHNDMGPIIHDEPCLANDEVFFIGQAICLIAAETDEACLAAEKKIIIEYEALEAITDLETAISKDNLLAPERLIVKGSVIDLIDVDLRCFQASADCMCGKRGIVFFTRKPFLLRGGNDLPVLDQAGSAIVIKSGNTENIHREPVFDRFLGCDIIIDSTVQ